MQYLILENKNYSFREIIELSQPKRIKHDKTEKLCKLSMRSNYNPKSEKAKKITDLYSAYKIYLDPSFAGKDSR